MICQAAAAADRERGGGVEFGLLAQEEGKEEAFGRRKSENPFLRSHSGVALPLPLAKRNKKGFLFATGRLILANMCGKLPFISSSLKGTLSTSKGVPTRRLREGVSLHGFGSDRFVNIS